MTIQLTPDQERIIREEVQSGKFVSAHEVLDHALAALREKKENAYVRKPKRNLAEFLTESPLAGAELDLERQKDYGRPIPL
jgi:Arc/MetJ-type ribon-helix-helix transcriptional regulator